MCHTGVVSVWCVAQALSASCRLLKRSASKRRIDRIFQAEQDRNQRLASVHSEPVIDGIKSVFFVFRNSLYCVSKAPFTVTQLNSTWRPVELSCGAINDALEVKEWETFVIVVSLNCCCKTFLFACCYLLTYIASTVVWDWSFALNHITLLLQWEFLNLFLSFFFPRFVQLFLSILARFCL